MRKAIAIDFDGCLCKMAWPEIGEPHMEVINAAIQEKANGTALILWTCRVGKLLDEAVKFCEGLGLTFDAVNENLPERIKYYQSESRKVSADEYWDDKAVIAGKSLIVGPREAVRLTQQKTEKNDPLTLAELQNMDGKPVWGELTDGRKGYGLVCVEEFGNMIFIRLQHDSFLAFNYGIPNKLCWSNLYRRPPEGQEG